VGSATAFADILDEIVSGFGQSPGVADPRFEPRYVPPHPFLFTEPFRPFRPSPYRGAHRQERAGRRTSPPSNATPRPARKPARPSRTLTTRQRQALEAFVELGAELTADFTPGELRSAYRRLALKYHPDRHAAGSDDEKARLTRVLADLNEHHRELMAALRSAA
jgi:hypothetical protein